jgi:hypothetical protein
MQLAHWIPTTRIDWLTNLIPAWVNLWFAVFPTRETIIAQLIAAVLVVGSYYGARYLGGMPRSENAETMREVRGQAKAAVPALSAAERY